MEYDVLIVGGGPAGLAAGIRLKQLCQENDADISVCLLEKGSYVGAHILSGNVFETRALNELLPNWQDPNSDQHIELDTQVTEDKFKILLNEKSSIGVPNSLLPKSIDNHGNYIISLSEMCVRLAEIAEELGVEILPGFAGDKVLYDAEDPDQVCGVVTNAFGIAKDGSKKDNYMPGMHIKAKQTVFTEGARGSLTEQLKEKFDLQAGAKSLQHYGLGLKEIWQVPESNTLWKKGYVQHTVNWPVSSDVYAGSFMYHMGENRIHLGYVVGLDYKNPYLNPYEEFQRLKTHPEISKYLEGGNCIEYGARVLNEGGYHAIPQLTFKGGMLAGCSAGFLNVAKIKGSHNAMKTGMLAAEAIMDNYKAQGENGGLTREDLASYETEVRSSWVAEELRASRNFKGGFDKGLWAGMIHGGFTQHITKGKEPWTFAHTTPDSATTGKAEDFKPIEYPKHDGVLTFDLLTNLTKSGTNHDHDQPAHLVIKEGLQEVPRKSISKFGGPEQRFCPAKVYEYVEDEKTGEQTLQINAQNCLHCKCCSIKMPQEYIRWTVPEGGGGPSYAGM